MCAGNLRHAAHKSIGICILFHWPRRQRQHSTPNSCHLSAFRLKFEHLNSLTRTNGQVTLCILYSTWCNSAADNCIHPFTIPWNVKLLDTHAPSDVDKCVSNSGDWMQEQWPNKPPMNWINCITNRTCGANAYAYRAEHYYQLTEICYEQVDVNFLVSYQFPLNFVETVFSASNKIKVFNCHSKTILHFAWNHKITLSLALAG